jgi:Endosomal/lysosomal potassium channel TMEM175
VRSDAEADVTSGVRPARVGSGDPAGPACSREALTKCRLEAFSGGVLAIAITLLVVELRPPQLHAGQPLAQALWQQWPSYLAYLASL